MSTSKALPLDEDAHLTELAIFDPTSLLEACKPVRPLVYAQEGVILKLLLLLLSSSSL